MDSRMNYLAVYFELIYEHINIYIHTHTPSKYINSASSHQLLSGRDFYTFYDYCYHHCSLTLIMINDTMY